MTAIGQCGVTNPERRAVKPNRSANAGTFGQGRLIARLSSNRAKIEALDAWAQSLADEADAIEQRAAEIRDNLERLEQALERASSAPPESHEDMQRMVHAMWDDLSSRVDELASRIESERVGE